MNRERFSMTVSLVVLTSTLEIFLLVVLPGCNTAPENHAPPTMESRAKTVTDNPHMSQAQKDDALAKIQQGQKYSSEVGGARQRGMEAAKKPAQ